MDGRESRRTHCCCRQHKRTTPSLTHLGRRNCAVRLDPAHAQPPLASRRWLTVDHRRAILQHFTPHGSSFSHTRGKHSLLLLRPLLKSGARKKDRSEKRPPPIVARVPQRAEIALVCAALALHKRVTGAPQTLIEGLFQQTCTFPLIEGLGKEVGGG